DHVPIVRRAAKDTGDVPLMSVSDFRQNHSANGYLFHGTADISGGLAILRDGLFLSKEGQGTALFGRGGYTSPAVEVARVFADGRGLVLKMRVRDELPLRIIDWPAVQGTDFGKRVTREAEDKGIECFEHLARQYNIDIIVHTHVLVQNTAALEMSKDAASIITAYSDVLSDPAATLRQRLLAYATYVGLFPYASALGADLTPPAPIATALAQEWRQLADHGDDHAALLESLLSYESFYEVLSPEERRVLGREPGDTYPLVSALLHDPEVATPARFKAYDMLFGARFLVNRPGDWPTADPEGRDIAALAEVLGLMTEGDSGSLRHALACLDDSCRDCGLSPEAFLPIERRGRMLRRLLETTAWQFDRDFLDEFHRYEEIAPTVDDAHTVLCHGIVRLLVDPTAGVLWGGDDQLLARFPRLDGKTRKTLGATLLSGAKAVRDQLLATDHTAQPDDFFTLTGKLEQIRSVFEQLGLSQRAAQPDPESLHKLQEIVVAHPDDLIRCRFYGFQLAAAQQNRELTDPERDCSRKALAAVQLHQKMASSERELWIDLVAQLEKLTP
ncbi:hypothetical protein ACFL6C_14205, partial [Myxococcota bacterium]